MLIAQIIGNLGRDAEVKRIGEKDYISFSVASTEKQGDQENTTWVSVLASNNPNLLPFLKKGQQVFVSGRMKAGIYQSQQNFGIDISVFAQTLQLCSSKKEESTTTATQSSQPTPATTQPASASTTPQQTVIYPDRETSPFPPIPPVGDETKDDLPF